MVFLHLFHGRKDPTEQLDDWGLDGPWLGPLDYFGGTYGDLKVGYNLDTFNLHVYEGLVYYDGVYYGDFEVMAPAPRPATPVQSWKLIPQEESIKNWIKEAK